MMLTVRRRLSRSTLLLASCALLALPAFAAAADYWVKNGGSDAADGLSVATAWATLGHAADEVGPGDTVHVLDGAYQGFYLDTSGTPGNPITFKAEGPNVEITADNGTTPDGINLEGASYVVIDGFVVNNRTRTGVRAVLGEFVTVRNCRLGYNGRWGILTGFVDDFTAEFNEAHHSQLEHGIYVSNSGDRPIVRDNILHDNHANGLHMNGDASLGGDGIISDALVERNVIYGNGAGGGSGINMDGVTDSLVRNNLLYDNHASGISLYRIDGGSGSTNNVVVNNTIINAADGRWAVNISGGSSGNTVLNNILYTFHSFRGAITVDSASQPGLVSDHNSVMNRFSTNGGNTVITLAAWQALGYDANSFIAAPADHFLVPGSDFHLLTDSPAVDAGTASNAPSIDLDGNPRPVGTGYDLGAYELQLVECNDGDADPGEQCGEPGLSCADPCTSCLQCICIEDEPQCGDAVVCGDEQCEDDGDCASGAVCQGCQCVNPPACTSGIVAGKPRLVMRANTFRLRTSGEAVIPKPWLGVDPLNNGVRIVIDAVSGPGGLDVTIPGGAYSNGAGWKTNSKGTRWRYIDPEGTAGGITRVVIIDKSHVQDGLLRWVVRGKSDGGVTLPDVQQVRAIAVLGTAAECAGYVWNPPGAARPRCDGDAAQVRCR
jgi:hypothetical protein